ncbi:copper transporter [Hepatocystis sp. ex Piliocolobus tephrosceles]|nr:copper transporter [Hepatocystis sp. ex Piliocolobus tephrosceles]
MNKCAGIVYLFFIIVCLFIANGKCHSTITTPHENHGSSDHSTSAHSTEDVASQYIDCSILLELYYKKKPLTGKFLFLYKACEQYEIYQAIINTYYDPKKGINDYGPCQDNCNNKHLNHSMAMTFQNSTHAVILFDFWETLNTKSYVVSLLICFIFGIISILLKVLRYYVEKALPIPSKTNIFTSKTLLTNNTIRLILAFIVYSFDYLIMLIVMTFNVGLFFAIVLGLSVGCFFFGNKFTNCNKNLNEDLSVNRGFYCDPACCG